MRVGRVGLCASFLTRMMDLKVAGLDESSEVDTAHIVLGCWSQPMHTIFTKVYLDQCMLIIVYYIQESFNTTKAATFLSQYNSIPKNQSPRLITLIPNILSSKKDSLSNLPHQLTQTQSLIPANVKYSCETAVGTAVDTAEEPVETQGDHTGGLHP